MSVALTREDPRSYGTVTRDPRGRERIYLGRSHSPVPGWRRVRIMMGRPGRRREIDAWVHPAANSGGWTWLPRFVAWLEGRTLRTEDHVHHVRGDYAGGAVSILPASEHGRLHARATLPYQRRDSRGRWLPSGGGHRIPRFAEIATGVA